MKGLLRSIAIVLLVLVFAVGSLMATAFVGRTAIEPGLTQGFVHVVKDGYVSVAILDLGGGEVALIDAGSDKSGGAILAELSAMNVDKSKVAAIFLTHGHGDHTAAIGQFPRAKVYALEPEVAAVEGREGFHGLLTRWQPAKPTGVKVTRGLKDGEGLRVGNRMVRVLAVPGHTVGSCAYWVDGVLFLGDSAGASSDDKLLASPWVFSDDSEQNKDSLRKLAGRLKAAQLQVAEIEFAHTGPLKGTAALEAFGKE